MDFRNDIRSYIACEIETLKKLDIDALNDALNLILKTLVWQVRKPAQFVGLSIIN